MPSVVRPSSPRAASASHSAASSAAPTSRSRATSSHSSSGAPKGPDAAAASADVARRPLLHADVVATGQHLQRAHPPLAHGELRLQLEGACPTPAGGPRPRPQTFCRRPRARRAHILSDDAARLLVPQPRIVYEVDLGQLKPARLPLPQPRRLLLPPAAVHEVCTVCSPNGLIENLCTGDGTSTLVSSWPPSSSPCHASTWSPSCSPCFEATEPGSIEQM